jgi:hypothetical protein
MMSKAAKKHYLNQDTRIFKTIGGMHGSVFDKQLSYKFNNLFLDKIIDDSDKFLTDVGGVPHKQDLMNTDKEMTMYVELGPNSKDKNAQEIWKVLPGYIQDRILANNKHKARGDVRVRMYLKKVQELNTGKISQRNFDDWMATSENYEAAKKALGSIYIRRDLMNDYFGYRKMSVGEIKALKGSYKRLALLAESWWQDSMLAIRTNIVMKIPEVLYSNIRSNFNLMMMYGVGPIEALRLHKEAMFELNRYLKLEQDIIDMATEKALINDPVLHKKIDQQIKLKTNELKKSKIRPLFEAGLYQQIEEDLTDEDIHKQTKVSEFGHMIMNTLGLNSFMKDTAELLYMTQKTKAFNFMVKAHQQSDTIFRYSLYYALLKKKNKDGTPKYTEQQVIQIITDAAINYNAADPKVLQYLNDISFVRFSKFFLRIQNVIHYLALEHPTEAALMLISQYMFANTDDVLDYTLIHKNYDALFPIQMIHPLDAVANLITPHGPSFALDSLSLTG